MTVLTALALAILATGASTPPPDPNAAAPGKPLSFRVFQNLDKPISGPWVLEIPGGSAVRLELKEGGPQQPGILLGVDRGSGAEVLRLERKKEGVGYAGELKKVFEACGLEAVPVREFLPLGDAIVLRFETPPPATGCPPIDSGATGKLEAFAARGGPVRLRNLSDISSPTVRDEYSIGGDRATTMSSSYRLDAVSLDPGSEVKFLQRMKAPLDGTIWFEVEAVVAAQAGVDPPRGFLKAETLRFIGSLSLKRDKG